MCVCGGGGEVPLFETEPLTSFSNLQGEDYPINTLRYLLGPLV